MQLSDSIDPLGCLATSTRREFLQRTLCWGGLSAVGTSALDRDHGLWHSPEVFAHTDSTQAAKANARQYQQNPGERPTQTGDFEVLNPRGRVPLSFVIDDSTCLVNLNKFALDQFHQAWPKRKVYQLNWRSWPQEIPDAFVRKFGLWCREHGVKGKYSIVPFPACVGWIDRVVPGWSSQQLQNSIKLVQELMVPDWDIHPEMVSHTVAVDIKTGRPYQPHAKFMENWGWTDGKSVEQLAEYIAYALRILKNVDLPCEGFTTPGGFGNRVRQELSRAALQSVSSVFGAEIPHYFKYVVGRGTDTTPRVENVSGLATGQVQCVVNVPAGTGDWYGGWTGVDLPQAERFITEDLQSGRMVELIEAGAPAVMLCHWTGIYSNGTEVGYQAFQKVVQRIAQRFSHQTLWMKLSDMARYWAAKELTTITQESNKQQAQPKRSKAQHQADNPQETHQQRTYRFDAPFAAPDFTVAVPAGRTPPKLLTNGRRATLREVQDARELKAGTWIRDQAKDIVCFDLPRKDSQLTVS